MDIKKRAAEYFKSHPNTSVFYLTSDGMAFFNKADAEAHARDLKDDKVFTERHPDQESPVQKIVDDIKARLNKAKSGGGNPEDAGNTGASEPVEGTGGDKAPEKDPDDHSGSGQEPVDKTETPKEPKAEKTPAPKRAKAKAAK